MGYSFSTETGDGVTVTFPFAFTGPDNGYWTADQVEVTVDGVAVAFTVTGPTQVTLAIAPAVDASVLIRRSTHFEAPYSDWSRGSDFTQTNMNRSFQEQLYNLQAVIDGFKESGYYEKQDLNMGTYGIVNMRDGAGDEDAVSYNQLYKTKDEDVDMAGFRVKSLGEAVLSDDAVTLGAMQIAVDGIAIGDQLSYFASVVSMVSNLLVEGVIYTTHGYYVPGDGGGSSYLIKSLAAYGSTPDGYADIEVNGGTHVAVLQSLGSIDIRQCGASDGEDIADLLASVLTSANASSLYKRVVVEGEYLISKTVLVEIDSEVHLDLTSSTLTAVDPYLGTKFLQFFGTGSIKITGGYLDVFNIPNGNQGEYVDANDAIYSTVTGNSTVIGTSIYAGSGLPDRGVNGSDSGIFLAGFSSATVSHCEIEGFTDAALYVSGDASATAGTDIAVTDNVMHNNNVCIISKRLAERQIITGNFLFNSKIGIAQGEASSGGGLLEPGVRTVMSNNILKNVGKGIESRWNNGAIISNNEIYEVGFFDGTVPTDGYGILVAGSVNTVVTGNTIAGVYNGATDGPAFVGVRITERSITGYTTRQSEYNLISSNNINLVRSIQEFNSPDFNKIINNLCRDIVTIGSSTLVLETPHEGEGFTIRQGSDYYFRAIASTGRIGIGTADPKRKTHIKESAQTEIGGVTGCTVLIQGEVDGRMQLVSEDGGSTGYWLGTRSNQAAVAFTYFDTTEETRLALGSGAIFDIRFNNVEKLRVTEAGVHLGPHGVQADTPTTGYIEVLDSGGVPRKLAVIS